MGGFEKEVGGGVEGGFMNNTDIVVLWLEMEVSKNHTHIFVVVVVVVFFWGRGCVYTLKSLSSMN